MKVKRKELNSMMHFLKQHLLGKRLAQNVQVNLHVVKMPEYQEGWMGYCCCVDTNIRPREFDVYIDNRMSKKSIIETLCHEMVHVKQWARGEMVQKFRPKNMILWMDREIRNGREPWETEAYRMQSELYDLLKEEGFV